jgi:hypothetical protein
MIVQSTGHDNLASISFTVVKKDLKTAMGYAITLSRSSAHPK